MEPDTEPDFSGWATRAGLKCTDGRTIMEGAFQHQDSMTVPLVWQHAHNTPTNVLGHVKLENREGGVYAYAFFNKSDQAEHARELVVHGDIKMMSIWANELVQKAGRVIHGAIREVSLVLAGANPGALIENVTLRHSEFDLEELEDQIIIRTGEEITVLAHADSSTKTADETSDEDDESLREIYDTLNQKQKDLFHFAVAKAASGVVVHDALSDSDDPTLKEIYENLDDQQKTLLHMLLGEASTKTVVQHSDLGDPEGETEPGEESDTETGDETTDDTDSTATEPGEESDTETGDTDTTDDSKGTDNMSKDLKHTNIFEKEGDVTAEKFVLAHDAMDNILADATKSGSFKEAVEGYALAHGIQDIDLLFPDARNLTDTPEFLSRRTEWVQNVLSKVRKSPFARVRTFSADLTVPEARAKGYITGALKKEEFFRVAKRVTTPTTIYKKQKLDRDDMIDITDFDVVTWLKGEMRLMLDEELARAILLGDGRAADDEDKISEDHIRPVATDHELYTTKVYVNIGDASSSISEMMDAIVLNRRHLRGSGLPTFYTTETTIAKLMLLRDGVGRRLYRTLDEAASEMRVDSIVPVEVMEEYPEILGILVNLNDYTVGADKGGNISMFDDFDIDYNQYKYLIETRASGALAKLKAAMVLISVPADDDLVTPAEPTYDDDLNEITIVDTAGVVYRNAETDVVMTNALSPYAVPEGESITVQAEPAAGKYFATSEDDSWTFTNEA